MHKITERIAREENGTEAGGYDNEVMVVAGGRKGRQPGSESQAVPIALIVLIRLPFAFPVYGVNKHVRASLFC